jgi:hypothetical protein
MHNFLLFTDKNAKCIAGDMTHIPNLPMKKLLLIAGLALAALLGSSVANTASVETTRSAISTRPAEIATSLALPLFVAGLGAMGLLRRRTKQKSIIFIDT